MRWRMIDRVTAFEPWRMARGVKAVSLEEYSLLAPFDRRGVFPETLVLETCVALTRLLIEKSTNFESSCVLREVESFRVAVAEGRGAVLRIAIEVAKRDQGSATIDCRVDTDDKRVAEGRIAVEHLPLRDLAVPAHNRDLWEELRGSS